MDNSIKVKRKFQIYLIGLSSILLGFSYPPFQVGVLAVFAYVPFFIAFESVESYGKAFRYAYFWLLLLHIITLYWTGGFTHCKDYYLVIAGVLLIIVHPFFYLPAIVAFVFIRKHFGYKIAIFSFPLIWLSIEYSRFLTQTAFPWLTLGNTQTYDLYIIQIAELTGVHGISLWILILNVLLYYLYAKLVLKVWKYFSLKSIGVVVVILIIYFIPKLYGVIRLQNYKVEALPRELSVKVAIVQPNIDPFEKWKSTSEWQLKILRDMTENAVKSDIDLVIWPETAIPYYLLHPLNREYYDLIRRLVDTNNISLLTGVPDIIYYSNGDSYPKSSKITSEGQRYDTFNSTILIQHHNDHIQKYAKIILVPFSERVPYSEELHFLNAMQWNFGLGGWGIGKDTTIFILHVNDSQNIKFCNLICYESIYPRFVANFVKKGAEFLTIVTNDSWWGNTSGAYQHSQYAVLRAVENRRWIARCANGGISCFISPIGEKINVTKMFERTIIVNRITLNNELTFYSKHGDWLPEMCLLILFFILASGFGKIIFKRVQEGLKDEVY